jgi:hypothetical protein
LVHIDTVTKNSGKWQQNGFDALKTTIELDGPMTNTVEFGDISEYEKLPSTNCTQNDGFRYNIVKNTHAYILSSIRELNKYGGAN